MKTAREFATVFYTRKIPQDDDSIHLIDYYLRIVAASGASSRVEAFNLTPPARAQDIVAELLEEYNVKPDRYAVLVPGSAHASKCWPVENFAALAGRIVTQFDLSIVAVGTTREKPLVQKLKSCAKVPIVDFAGLTDIPQLVALLKDAKLVVSNDTGPGHVAAALDVPLVMIFGTTNPARTCPYKRPNTVAVVDADKRGRDIESSNPRHAVGAVTVGHVFQRITCQLTLPAANPDDTG